jgi:hypothetical protein
MDAAELPVPPDGATAVDIMSQDVAAMLWVTGW